MEEGDGMSRRSFRDSRPNASIQPCRNAVDVTNDLAMLDSLVLSVLDRFTFVFARSV